MNNKLPIKYILVPCTNRKRSSLGKPIYYRDCDGTPESWIQHLSSKETGVKPADEVYCGSSWSNILKTRQLLPKTEFRIVSAGYGLIHDYTPISNYQATFQARTPDSVGCHWEPQSHANRQWWTSLAGDEWFNSLTNDDGIVLLQLSSVYLKALEPGLVKLAQQIGHRLMILSPGYKTENQALLNCLLPIDTRFEHIIKTTRSDMGSAALKWLISEFPPYSGWDVKKLHFELSGIFTSLPKIETHNRTLLSDKEILDFINIHVKHLKQPAASPLLRKLRDSNYACEQKRFSNIFKQWRSINDARNTQNV